MAFPPQETVVILGTSREDGNTWATVQAVLGGRPVEVVNLSDTRFTTYDYRHRNEDDGFLPLVGTPEEAVLFIGGGIGDRRPDATLFLRRRNRRLLWRKEISRTELDEYTYLDEKGSPFKVNTRDVVEVQPLPTSIMPAGLIDRMTDQELRDLLAYLCSRR